ncbi:LysR family transcriptional regulator [Mycobacterium paraense]|uniref:Probable hydrogen peroxide-inducible genes activator n=1 Tax=Mycobacterium paraense TaxID=767916 RepID=A0A1X2AFK3_9MYCO|nr:LysR family transcriptional regulator [Mycobacterium paraense]MCV7443833.1 LysR family transcriptional regulator [Mycobacterium paraense]ORW26717.1 LysR family transcriptional regulator [Mycobacterium paraense]ORW42237.1 LysR family transcriptional regulator [Mycobacterium paraense]ORW46354.1 LysR family transcriptional regulator [Mycobacterium paraense]ORW50175.1 LysR family transcriptional regulator [Mycobacterium paraense]
MPDGDYEWFVTLAELEHVTAAAGQLHIAQPTLTRMLARLERQLGVALFDRRGKRLALNTYGRIFYEHARRAQSELDSARRAIDDLANPAVGEIRLGFLGSFGSTVVPRLIAGFAEASPRVTFTLEEGAAESIGDLVQSGSIDMGVVSPRPQAPNLAWRGLFRQRLGVAFPCDHALAGAAAVSMTDLADEPFVAMRPGFGMRRLLDELCAAAQIQPRIVLESANLTSTVGLVAAGLGISLMPIDGSDHAPGVSVLPLADADAYRDVGMIWNSGRPLSRPARDFIASAAALHHQGP